VSKLLRAKTPDERRIAVIEVPTAMVGEVVRIGSTALGDAAGAVVEVGRGSRV
jgi:hypothetical protein